MKAISGLEKRLEAAKKRMQHENCLEVSYTPQITATVQILTNMPPEDGTIELHWPGTKSAADDETKHRWLAQYRANQINEFRATWKKSPWKRDKVALRELDRLQSAFQDRIPGHEGESSPLDGRSVGPGHLSKDLGRISG